ncbi:MAG: hypothetical protein HY513_04660 [Candidatus Aenigmarchaeota archaeon]|nr:hypothetical protein [Candidatus Aenigmarchaeota archaeon]
MISGKGLAQYTDAFRRGEVNAGDQIGVKVPGFFQEDGGTLFYKVLADGNLQCRRFAPVRAAEVLHEHAKWEQYPK